MLQPTYHNLLTEENHKKIHVLEVLIYFKTYLNSLQTPSLDGILLGNFTLSNSIILVEEFIKWKRCPELFLIDYCAGDIRNKNITGNY